MPMCCDINNNIAQYIIKIEYHLSAVLYFIDHRLNKYLYL